MSIIIYILLLTAGIMFRSKSAHVCVCVCVCVCAHMCRHVNLFVLKLQLCTSADYHNDNKTFLNQIFCSINWTTLVSYYRQHEVEEITRRLYACYLSILVRLSQQITEITVSRLRLILSQNIINIRGQ